MSVNAHLPKGPHVLSRQADSAEAQGIPTAAAAAARLHEAGRKLAELEENLCALRRCQAMHQVQALVQGAPFLVHASGGGGPKEQLLWYRCGCAPACTYVASIQQSHIGIHAH
jgi:hypothetical protein